MVVSVFFSHKSEWHSTHPGPAQGDVCMGIHLHSVTSLVTAFSTNALSLTNCMPLVITHIVPFLFASRDSLIPLDKTSPHYL